MLPRLRDVAASLAFYPDLLRLERRIYKPDATVAERKRVAEAPGDPLSIMRIIAELCQELDDLRSDENILQLRKLPYLGKLASSLVDLIEQAAGAAFRLQTELERRLRLGVLGDVKDCLPLIPEEVPRQRAARLLQLTRTGAAQGVGAEHIQEFSGGLEELNSATLWDAVRRAGAAGEELLQHVEVAERLRVEYVGEQPATEGGKDKPPREHVAMMALARHPEWVDTTNGRLARKLRLSRATFYRFPSLRKLTEKLRSDRRRRRAERHSEKCLKRVSHRKS